MKWIDLFFVFPKIFLIPTENFGEKDLFFVHVNGEAIFTVQESFSGQFQLIL